MTSDWQEAYSKLKDFITENPAVEIEPSRVHLPDEVRPGFYRLFDAVRTALIEEKLPALVGEAELLSQNYTRVEAEVVALLGLEGVSTSLPLHGFLHSPMKELRRGAFDPLFDLLKGRIATEAFVERVLQNVEASFWSLYQLGYEKWALLSLVKLLGADKLFQTVLPKLTLYDAHKKGGGLRQEVPPVEESKRLSFKLDASEAFVTPDLIVHSTTANKYISIRSQIKQSFTAAVNPNDKREWYPLSSFTAIEPSLTLVYIADDPAEIAIVADVDKICHPDLIIECKGQKDWYQKGELEKTRFYNDKLKPVLGSYIISRNPVPELKPEEQEEGINILTVGFDQSRLEAVIKPFRNQHP